jgi:hypothetical protein
MIYRYISGHSVADIFNPRPAPPVDHERIGFGPLCSVAMAYLFSDSRTKSKY